MDRCARLFTFLAVAVILAVNTARADFNQLVLQAIDRMPQGGVYAASKPAFDGLNRSISLRPGGLVIAPEIAQPSFCSGATYLVFVQAIEQLQREGAIQLERQTLAALPVVGQRDGQGIWGRWNANGPGTARLFHELNLGENFTDFSRARPGDFMKIFWTAEIGKKERGHSVIYLDTGVTPGSKEESVRFWSSNLASSKGGPSGYGFKVVPRSKIARAIFSRLETPSNLNSAPGLPKIDPFLASLLSRSVDFEEVRRQCGF